MKPYPLPQQLEDDDLTEQFAEYTISDLHSNLLKLVQLNVAYLYCESLIIEELDCDLKVAKVLKCCQDKSYNLLSSDLPFELLIKLKQSKDEMNKGNWNRQHTIDLILNLIVDNTLLQSSLLRFVNH